MCCIHSGGPGGGEASNDDAYGPEALARLSRHWHPKTQTRCAVLAQPRIMNSLGKDGQPSPLDVLLHMVLMNVALA